MPLLESAYTSSFLISSAVIQGVTALIQLILFVLLCFVQLKLQNFTKKIKVTSSLTIFFGFCFNFFSLMTRSSIISPNYFFTSFNCKHIFIALTVLSYALNRYLLYFAYSYRVEYLFYNTAFGYYY